MSTKGKTRVPLDSPEDIQRCLHCERAKCNDCIGRRLPDPQEMFKRKTDGYKKRMLNATAKEVLRLYPTAKSDNDIAKKMGRPQPTVAAVRRKLGLPPVRAIPKNERLKLAELWLERGRDDGKDG